MSRADNGLVFSCPPVGAAFFLTSPGHDPGVHALINELKRGTFIDVGAHVGFFALSAARQMRDQGRVIAIEPHPIRCAMLRSNIAANRVNNVDVVEAAVTDYTGRAAIYDLSPELAAHPRDVSFNALGGRPIDVEAVTLDSLCKRYQLTELALVKIDVEGFEVQVLRGMASTLRQLRPLIIFEALDEVALRACTELLLAAGYAVSELDSHQNYLAKPVRSSSG
jgi:FkbM family methyltransferase